MVATTDAAGSGKTDIRCEFERLYQQNSRRVYHLAYRLVGNAADAEDVTQDAFVRAWKHFDHYDPARPFERWLFRIVSNLAADRYRQQMLVKFYSLDALSGTDAEGARFTCVPPDVSDGPEAQVLSEEFNESLQAALDALPPKYRIPVLFAYVDGLSYDTIA